MMAQMGLMSAVMAAVWRINQRVPGMKPWSLAYGLGFLACVEFVVRSRVHPLPEVVSVVLTQGLLVGMGYLCYDGARRHVGATVLPRWAGLSFLGVVVLVSALFTVWRSSLGARFLVMSTALGSLFILTARTLAAGGWRRYPARHVLGIACLGHGAFLLARPWLFSIDGSGMLTSQQMGAVSPAILLETVVAQNVIALCMLLLASEHSSQALQRLVDRDALTGVLSRRAFLARLASHERPLAERTFAVERALLLIDLDHFKQINDSWGHGVGDLALRHFVDVVSGCLREEDAMGRLGGEEFGVLLPRTTYEQGCGVAERLRSSLAARTLAVQDARVFVTASIGVTMIEPADTAETALSRADQAMYQAKTAGRNRVASLLAGQMLATPLQRA